jgi:hypothetical protein
MMSDVTSGPEQSIRYVAIERPDRLKRILDIGSFAISFVTLVILGAGIYFALEQTNKLRESIDTARESIDTSAYNTVATQLIDVHKVLIDHPDMVKYIYFGEKIDPDSKNYWLAWSVANLFLNFFDDYTAMEPHFNVSDTDIEAWHRYIGDTFTQSPLMCQILKDAKEEYGSALVNMAKGPCKWPSD